MYQYKALSLKLFFLYIAGGVQTLKCMCSKIPSSEKKKKGNLPNNFGFFPEKNPQTLNFPHSVSQFNCLFAYC